MSKNNNKKDITLVLAEVASAVVGQFEMTQLLNKIINTTMETLNAEVCSIFLEDKTDEPNILKCVAGSGFAKNIVGIAKYEIGEGFTGTVAKLGREFNITSRKKLEELRINGKKVWDGKFDNKQWPSRVSEFRNCIALPLKIKNNILGVIKVENKDVNFGNYFTDDDLTIFKTIANVIALTIENAKLHHQIEDQLKTIAAKAAHRINNQVTCYDGIELDLIDESDAPVPNRQYLSKLADRISITTQNLKSMINDFKNYGKPIILNKIQSNINQVITNEVWYAKPPNNIEIEKQLDERIPEFNFDAGRLAESIKEILHNAIRVLKEKNNFGKIKISTELLKDKNNQHNVVLLKIEDNGPGFPPDFPVFSAFHSTDPQRTGLGLATVKELIEAHGGNIKYSTSNNGVVFKLTIPIV